MREVEKEYAGSYKKLSQDVRAGIARQEDPVPTSGQAPPPPAVAPVAGKYPDSNPPKVQLPSKGKEQVPVDKKAANGKGTVAAPQAPSPPTPVTSGGDDGPTSEQQDWAEDYRQKKVAAHKSWLTQDSANNPT